MDGAQGRNRTTDTAIFSRMLYQLSYLGIRVAAHSPCPPADQAGSAGNGDASSAASSGAAGMLYCSVNQRPRSTSAQRRLQNGRALSAAGLPQIGQDGAGRLASGIARLDHPSRAVQVRIRPQNQGTTSSSCKIRQCLAVSLQRRHDRG